MGWLITAIIGAIVGLLYGIGVNVDRRLHWLINLLIGIVGAVLGVWLFFIVLGLSGTTLAANFWLMVLWSIVGSVILMAIVDGIVAMSHRSESRIEERRMHERGTAHEYEEEPMHEHEYEEDIEIHKRKGGRGRR